MLKESSLFHFQKGECSPLLLILDRRCDPITPLLNQVSIISRKIIERAFLLAPHNVVLVDISSDGARTANHPQQPSQSGRRSGCSERTHRSFIVGRSGRVLRQRMYLYHEL